MYFYNRYSNGIHGRSKNERMRKNVGRKIETCMLYGWAKKHASIIRTSGILRLTVNTIIVLHPMPSLYAIEFSKPFSNYTFPSLDCYIIPFIVLIRQHLFTIVC